MRTALVSTAALVFAVALMAAAKNPPPAPKTPPANVPLYRLMNRNGDHFYTASASERDRAIKGDGYTLEGVMGLIWSTQVPGSEALYRLYNGSNGHHDHFYTANPKERQEALRDGYKDERVAGYILKTQLPGTIPVYRLYSPGTVEHFYTASEKEREVAEKNDGFKNEGILGYVAPPPPSKSVKPLAASIHRRER